MGLGNDLSVKFILEIRKTALELLRTRYLSAGEGVHMICYVFGLLEELPDKEFPRNYFLLEAANAIRKNAHPSMDLKAKDLILSGIFVALSRDEILGLQSLRHLFGILDFFDSELRIASSEHLEFLAHHIVDFYIKRSYDFISVKKASQPNSSYLSFGIDRIRIHLVRLVRDLLPKIENERERAELARDLANLKLKFSEAERIIGARLRAKNMSTSMGCRKRLLSLGAD
jgi:hypothetical protein